MSRLLGPFTLHVLWSFMSGPLAGQASSFSHVARQFFDCVLDSLPFLFAVYRDGFVCLLYIFNYYLMGYHACVTLIISLLGLFLAFFLFSSRFSARW